MADRTKEFVEYRVQVYRSAHDRWDDFTWGFASTPEEAWEASKTSREVAADRMFRVVEYRRIETWTVVE